MDFTTGISFVSHRMSPGQAGIEVVMYLHIRKQGVGSQAKGETESENYLGTSAGVLIIHIVNPTFAIELIGSLEI